MQRKQKKYPKVPKSYQRKLRDVGLYKGLIDGDFGPMTSEADSTFRAWSDEGLTDEQMFQRTLGGPKTDDWGKYMRSGKIEDTVIDSMKNER